MLLSQGSDNTAVGAAALENNNADGNTATGSFALFANMSADGNTAMGFEALLFNDRFNNGLAIFNSAVGSQALVFNTDGAFNSAFGFAALALNDIAGANTAVGTAALEFNDASANGLANFNTTVGFAAMINNIDGAENTVVGDEAGQNLVGPFPLGFNNTYVGQTVGNGVPDESDTIRIADLSGGNSQQCFIGGIFNNFQPVGGSVVEVTLDLADDHLGWDVGPNQALPSVPTRSAPAPRGKPQPPFRPQASAVKAALQRQAMLGDKVETLQATVAQQQKQIETLTAQLKEQAAQIQKVSAEVEMIKPAPRVVENR